jgi:hypothetical protein
LFQGPPSLRDNFFVLLEEDISRNIPVDLREQPSGFPEPTVFSWMRGGEPFTTRPRTYSSITFDTVTRDDTGTYTVTATNFAFGAPPAVEVGSDTGSFSLNVLCKLHHNFWYYYTEFYDCADGPSFRFDGPQQIPTQVYVLLGNPLSLVCGRGLESNPNATITWTGSDGTTIMDTLRYDLENGPDIVRLNFTRTIMSDNGMWLCEIEVTSQRHALDNNGDLIIVGPEVIGQRLRHQFQLTIICELRVKIIGHLTITTYIFFCSSSWSATHCYYGECWCNLGANHLGTTVCCGISNFFL